MAYSDLVSLWQKDKNSKESHKRAVGRLADSVKSAVAQGLELEGAESRRLLRFSPESNPTLGQDRELLAFNATEWKDDGSVSVGLVLVLEQGPKVKPKEHAFFVLKFTRPAEHWKVTVNDLVTVELPSTREGTPEGEELPEDFLAAGAAVIHCLSNFLEGRLDRWRRGERDDLSVRFV